MRSYSESPLTAIIFIFFLSLSACGGGSSGSGNTGTGGDSDLGGDTDAGIDDPSETIKSTGFVINEIMKSIELKDDSSIKDETNMRQPWLELYNGSGQDVSLTGYSLVSIGFEKHTWPLPDTTLANGAHLRIWGSGLDRSTNLSALHTNFSLMASDKLFLVDSAGSTLDYLKLIVPADESWGRYPDGSKTGFFYTDPTPGRSNPLGSETFSLNCRNLSLTAKDSFQLRTSPETAVSWTSESPDLTINSSGQLTVNSDGAVGRHKPMKITARDATNRSRSCLVTVVNWKANRSSLTLGASLPVDFFLGYFDDAVYFTQPGKTLTTNNGFKTTQQVGSFPPTPSPPIMKKTPYGYFVSSGAQLYSTMDFNTWQNELTMRHKTLQHGFAHHYDNNSQTSYLYAGEYSTGKEDLHAIYRGKSTGGNTQWQSVLDWQSEGTFDRDNSNLDTIRHVHVTVTDPYTGHVWVGTGDEDQHSRLYYSKDNGNTFTLLATGSQKFRTLSVWFTEDYVYWNMDTERAKQHVYRLPRSEYRKNNAWPVLTPELDSGSTKTGVRYMVKATNGGNFPVTAGNLYTETAPRPLSSNERAFAINDPQYDYSQSVAELTHASHWYHLWVKDQNNEDVLLMATSAEGSEAYRRDNNSRVFGFKEHSDGYVDVQELLSMASNTPDSHNPYTQLIPAMQDDSGNIYFRGRNTGHRAYQMRLNWVDQ